MKITEYNLRKRRMMEELDKAEKVMYKHKRTVDVLKNRLKELDEEYVDSLRTCPLWYRMMYNDPHEGWVKCAMGKAFMPRGKHNLEDGLFYVAHKIIKTGAVSTRCWNNNLYGSPLSMFKAMPSDDIEKKEV